MTSGREFPETRLSLIDKIREGSQEVRQRALTRGPFKTSLRR